MAKRLYSLLTIGSVLSGTLYVVACGGNSGGKKPDAKIILSDSKGADAKGCSAAASYTPSFGSQNQAALNYGSGSGYTEDLLWQGELSAAPAAFMGFEVLSGGGSANTPDWPTGNVSPKSGIDLASANAQKDAFMYIGANLDGSGRAQDIYLATAGIVNITQAGGTGSNFAGNASGLEFTHVDIGSSSITPNPDGCTTSIASMSWSAKIVAGFEGKKLVPNLAGLDREGFTVAGQ